MITTAREQIDRHWLLACLRETYWAAELTPDELEIRLQHSLCFGLYASSAQAMGRQIGFARLVTDFSTFAYPADVILDPAYRGQGHGRWLMECLLAHPELQKLRRWVLRTRDAHAFYAPLGFVPLPDPERYLERPGGSD
ncbi:MAG: GNAT family N-acetyltransferase [Candidatus Sericytochromatia bacterium]